MLTTIIKYGKDHRYELLTLFLLAGLVFSKFLLSFTQIIFILVVASDANARRRLLNALRHPLLLLLIAFYLYHIVGLLWSEDMKYAMHDLRIKLPLLTFPIMFAAAGMSDRKTIRRLALAFVAMVALMSLFSLIRYYISPTTPNNIALFHSHIRFSLLICLSLVFLLHYSINSRGKILIPIVMTSVILLWFLIVLSSFTGFVVLAALLIIVPWLYRHQIRNRITQIAVLAIPFLTIILVFAAFNSVRNQCFSIHEHTESGQLDSLTISGHPYLHDRNAHLKENGYHVYYYIEETEMCNAWNQRSDHKVFPADSATYAFRNIIMRYVTSKGLHKDSTGIMSLTDKDIQLIEAGYTNYLLPTFDPIRKRIYGFLWEWNVYQETGNPSGHSLTQRIEYWKAALHLIASNPLLGAGTGDPTKAFHEEYDRMHSMLGEKFRLRSHNQFLSTAVQLGIPALILFLITLIVPFIMRRAIEPTLYISFIFIFLLSMLNEDTLETQVGVSFYALFNSLFLLWQRPEPKK